MSIKKQILIIFPLCLILAALLYFIKAEQKNINPIANPQIVHDNGRYHVVAQFRNPTDTPYKNISLQINILASWRKIAGSTLIETEELLPGITWFFKAPLAPSDGRELVAGALNCRAKSAYQNGSKLIINCLSAVD